jgi:hypothetical protein
MNKARLEELSLKVMCGLCEKEFPTSELQQAVKKQLDK